MDTNNNHDNDPIPAKIVQVQTKMDNYEFV